MTPEPPPLAPGGRPPTQATVSAFDATTRHGRVLLDTGVELPFAPDALLDSGLRLLRRGQRVRVVITSSPQDWPGWRVQAVRLLTLPGTADRR